jgi:hypothetical protein
LTGIGSVTGITTGQGAVGNTGATFQVIVIGTDRTSGSIGASIAVRGASPTSATIKIIAGVAGLTGIGDVTGITTGDGTVGNTGATFQVIVCLANRASSGVSTTGTVAGTGVTITIDEIIASITRVAVVGVGASITTSDFTVGNTSATFQVIATIANGASSGVVAGIAIRGAGVTGTIIKEISGITNVTNFGFTARATTSDGTVGFTDVIFQVISGLASGASTRV